MIRISGLVIASIILSTSLHAQNPATPDPWSPDETIYKHYTGTVGGKKAVLDLRYGYIGGSNFGGSTCYITDEGGLDFFIISQPPSILHTEVLRAQVFPENLPLSEVKNAYSIYVQTPRFEFQLLHDTLKGRWFVPNTQDPLIVFMTEDKTNALQADFAHAVDSTFATNKKNEKIIAAATYTGIQLSPKMKTKERTFITEAFAQFLGGKTSKESTDLSQICIQKFFTDFKSAAKKGGDLGGTNFSGNYTVFPVYGDNGFLVLQKGGFQYDFENKEYTDRNTYLCLDMTNKKTLKITDVLDVNNELLSSLLEKAFRKKYQLDPGKKLSDLFNTDKMPTTDNFILVNKGLIFSYSPVKIFHDSEDISELQEMRIFLSYDELASMVKPEFKKRI